MIMRAFFPESIRFGKQMNRVFEELVLKEVFDGTEIVTRSKLVERLTPYMEGTSEIMHAERLPGVAADYVIDELVTYGFLQRANTPTERAYRLNLSRFFELDIISLEQVDF